MTTYYRPIPQSDPHRPVGALTLAGGWLWFDGVEVLERGRAGVMIPAQDVPADVRRRLTAPRADIAGLSMAAPRIMGILNVTPDSFSDGGLFDDPVAALAHARAMEQSGAEILDIGGESTRPGAAEVQLDAEIARTAPVIAAIRAGSDVAISIDTRKAGVAAAAIAAGACMVNDVAAFTHDPALVEVAARAGLPVCLMHAQGDPETMQADPRYDDVLLDVYDFLADRVAVAEAAGIPRSQIIVDPGIGFGKTLQHNVTLMRGISLYHNLGCPILLGASRKRFIGTIGHAAEAQDRTSGSVAVALHGVAQGVQILRVHDIKDTRQALSLHMALNG
jgi:dihydropteroate synthase